MLGKVPPLKNRSGCDIKEENVQQGGGDVEVFVTAQPHMLYETVELLYAYVNGIPARVLTQSGPYCLPVDAVQNMLELACADVSRDDPEMQYYFGKYLLSQEPERATCIARNLAYNIMDVSTGTIAGDCEQLRSSRERQLCNRERCTAIDEYRLLYMESGDGGFIPLAQDIAKLGLRPEYSQMLLEQFSGFDQAITRLETLLTPVATKLKPLLLPWVEQAQPLAEAWRDYYQQPDFAEKWRKRVRCSEEERPLEAIRVQLRYLHPKAGPGSLHEWEQTAFLHTGVAVSVEQRETESFESWEFQALRLLGSEARMRMLRAMLDKPMSARGLAQMLDLHLGVVGRDIGNLFNAKLLTIEVVNGRGRYRTNRESLAILAKHLSQLEKFELF